MKVLKNNFNKISAIETLIVPLYPKKVICDKCQSELEYEQSDITIGWFGAGYIKCPLCDNDIVLDDEDGINLTVDNVEFPTHFHHTSTNNGAKNVCNNKEIKGYIRKAIDYFRENKDAFSWYSGTGNLLVHVYRFDSDEDYHVVISENYYDTYIPFELEDYDMRSVY